MKLGALIVDDERLARNELKRLLDAHPEIEVVGEAKEAEEAVDKIESLDPDLLFLDIHMPGKDGFELLADLDSVPEVVFTTAYDEYAIRAFEVNALDYLLKPIEPERLAAAVEKVLDRIADDEDGNASAPTGAAPDDEPIEVLEEGDRVFVKDGERCWFVRLGDVRLFESAGNYTVLHLAEERPMVQRTLTYLEERLDPKAFFRANRKHIINLRRVESIDQWFKGRMLVRLEGSLEVEMSRRKAATFRKIKSL